MRASTRAPLSSVTRVSLRDQRTKKNRTNCGLHCSALSALLSALLTQNQADKALLDARAPQLQPACACIQSTLSPAPPHTRPPLSPSSPTPPPPQPRPTSSRQLRRASEREATTCERDSQAARRKEQRLGQRIICK